MAWIYANNAVGTLAASIGPTDLEIQLSPGQYVLFPVLAPGGDTFFITLTDVATKSLIEILEVTATDTNVFTVLRGQDGTTAQSWNANDIVSARSIAQEHNDYFSKTFGGVVAGATEFQQVLTCDSNVNCAAIVQAAGFNVTSDRRLKINIRDEESGLMLAGFMRPVQYQLKNEPGVTKHGFIAQELEEYLPELVRGRDETIRSVDYIQVISILVAAVQELHEKVQYLEVLAGDKNAT